MSKYIITEKQNVNSYREGQEKEFNSLTAAKRYASKEQCFLGTVITIEDRAGLIAYKKGGVWVNCFK